MVMQIMVINVHLEQCMLIVVLSIIAVDIFDLQFNVTFISSTL